MIAGFTGSRNGMNKHQCKELKRLLKKHKVNILHHGCCIGADEQAHDIARTLSIRIIGHPPNDEEALSLCTGDCDVLIPERSYLDRNRDIVDDSEMLFVGPDGPEKLRSGTWSTKRYAKQVGKRFIILPLEE